MARRHRIRLAITRIGAVRTMLAVVLVLLLGGGVVSARLAGRVIDRTWSLWFSPGARHLAVGSDSGVTVYEPGGAGHLFAVPGGRRAAFTPDGHRVGVSTPKNITVIELSTGAKTAEFPARGDWTTSITFSPDGQCLAALADQSSTLEVWDVAAGARRWSVEAHGDADYAIAFSPDGRVIATGGREKGATSVELRLWNSETGERVRTVEIPRHAYVNEVAFISGGKGLMVVFSDAKANAVYDLSDPYRARQDRDHPLAMFTGHVVLSPDGRYAATSRWIDTWSQAVVAVNLADRETVLDTGGLNGLYWDAAFGPEGRSLSVAMSAGNVSTWDLAGGGRTSMFATVRPARAPHWLLLGGAPVAWTLAWIGVHVIRRCGARLDGDSLLVPLTGACAGVVIVLLHWIQLAEPWAGPDPISGLGSLGWLEVGCFIAIVIASIVTRSWRALATTIAVFPILMLLTAHLWMDAVASV